MSTLPKLEGKWLSNFHIFSLGEDNNYKVPQNLIPPYNSAIFVRVFYHLLIHAHPFHHIVPPYAGFYGNLSSLESN